MGLAEDIASVLKNQLKCHVAWVPISNTFAIGDYGVFSKGVFTKLGNISEFGTKFETKAGPPAKIDFVSSGTKVANFEGAAQVDVLAKNAIDAKVKVSFEKKNSFMLRAKTVTVSEAQNIAQVMRQLAQLQSWRKSYKVVGKTWKAERGVLMATAVSDTTVSVSGSVPALEQFKLGDLSADVQISASSELGLQLVGASGIVGLGLLRHKFFGGVGYLHDGGENAGEFEEVAPSDTPEDDL